MQPVRAALQQVDPDQPLYEVRTMEERLAMSLETRRTPMMLLVAFGAIALILSAIGIYGVLAYTVSQRVRELGIRQALGAGRGDILRMVMRQGLTLAAIGIVAGGVASFWLATLLKAQLFGVTPRDPVVFVAGPAILLPSRSRRAACRRSAPRGSIRWSPCATARSNDRKFDQKFIGSMRIGTLRWTGMARPMPNRDAFRWFKDTFHPKIRPAINGTPFTLDLLAAIAAQETGHIWGPLHDTLDLNNLLAICVGDTLDADGGRGAFPKTKAELIAAPRGQDMFNIAREALVQMAVHVPDFQPVSKRPNKFCHGYGIFQLDLQFFKDDPDHFLNKRWFSFDVVSRQVRAGTACRAEAGEARRTDVAHRPRAGARRDCLQRGLVRRVEGPQAGAQEQRRASSTASCSSTSCASRRPCPSGRRPRRCPCRPRQRAAGASDAGGGDGRAVRGRRQGRAAAPAQRTED